MMDAAKINRAIAELVYPKGFFRFFKREDLDLGGQVYEPEEELYDPMNDPARAFELLERFRLKIGAQLGGDMWHVEAYKQTYPKEYPRLWQKCADVSHIDLKTAICLCILRMHGIDPETI